MPLIVRALSALHGAHGGAAGAESLEEDAASGPDSPACQGSFDDSHWGLRIGAIFIILATSLFGTLLPIVLRKSNAVPRAFYDFAKYFGSGVIIATAFMHLLAPAFDALGSECLTGVLTEYDWAPAIALMSVFAMFFAEVAAYRLGTKKLMKLGVSYSSHADDDTDAHAHNHRRDPPLNVDTSGPDHPGHVHPEAIPEATAHDHLYGDNHAHGDSTLVATKNKELDVEAGSDGSSLNTLPSHAEGAAQLVAVAVLEFGVVLHSVIIGLTLAVSEEFIVLFIVIIFHQMFEGLGLGSRLSGLQVRKGMGWSLYAAAVLYSICTPVGIAAGLGVRHTYNGNGATANIVSGVLDATSAGILMYTGLVELLAHEIVLNPRMMKSSTGKLAYVFTCMSLGAGLMAVLARWA